MTNSLRSDSVIFCINAKTYVLSTSSDTYRASWYRISADPSLLCRSFFIAIPIVLDSAIGSSAWGQELAYKFSMFNCFCGRLQMFQNSIHIHQHRHFLIMIGHEANIIRSFFILSFFTAIPIVLDSAIASGAWEGSSVARHRNYPIIDCFERRVVRVPSGQEVAEHRMEGEI